MKFQEIIDAFDRCQTETLRLVEANSRYRLIRIEYQNEHIQDYPIYGELERSTRIGIGISTDYIYARFSLPGTYRDKRVSCFKDNLDDLAKSTYNLVGLHYKDVTKEAEKHLFSVILQDKLLEFVPSGKSDSWQSMNGWHVGVNRVEHGFHKLRAIISKNKDDHCLDVDMGIELCLDPDAVPELEPIIKAFDSLLEISRKLKEKHDKKAL